MDQQTRTELEAAAFRTLVEHLRNHTEVQNIEMMNLAGFCRNCLSKWMKAAADERGVEADFEAIRESIYGMPYDQWKAKYQKEASEEQIAAYKEHVAQEQGSSTDR
ncbi:MAG: DUF1244 domain-containing protein [Alphaproteobacteria bacterium]|nr:DUF1244 domain-containing protein [Alphaproteobacteria bacterium]